MSDSNAIGLISALNAETRDDSIDPPRLAGIFYAVLEEAREGVPTDLSERLDAIGSVAASARNAADDAARKAQAAQEALADIPQPLSDADFKTLVSDAGLSTD